MMMMIGQLMIVLTAEEGENSSVDISTQNVHTFQYVVNPMRIS